MLQIKLKDIKKGDFFTLKNYGEFPDENKVYVKGDFDRSSKKYSVYKFSDVNNETFKKGDLIVFTDFIF